MAESNPRAESLRLVRSGEFPHIDLPDLHTHRTEEEITAVLDELKPKQYTQLATVIAMLLDDMLQLPPPAKRRPIDTPYKTSDPWDHLKSDISDRTFEGIMNICLTPEYTETAETTRFIGTLNPGRHHDLALQLHAGMMTATISMLSVLRNLPDMIALHASAPQDIDLERTARQSMGIPMRYAMTCVSRMMAARRVVALDEDEKILDPNRFELRMHNDNTASLRFVEFAGIEVPAGYKERYAQPGLSEATTVGELACHSSVIIGCPITLLKGRMQELWNWQIDLVLQRDIWHSPDASPAEK
jgi:hypothetical protein